MYLLNEIQNFRKMNNMGLLITGSEFPKKLSSARKIIDERSSPQQNFSRTIAHMLTIHALRFVRCPARLAPIGPNSEFS